MSIVTINGIRVSKEAYEAAPAPSACPGVNEDTDCEDDPQNPCKACYLFDEATGRSAYHDIPPEPAPIKRWILAFEAPEAERDLVLTETITDLVTDGYTEGQYSLLHGTGHWGIVELGTGSSLDAIFDYAYRTGPADIRQAVALFREPS